MRPIVQPQAVGQRPTTNRERGANIVEFAIIAPLIALLVMGLLELGLAWRDSLTVATAARSGARVGSNLGPERLADYETIQSVLAAMADIDDADLEQVIIYNATAADGAVPAACLSTGLSQAGVCNVYNNADLFTLSTADFASNGAGDACDPLALDAAWCPFDRVYATQHTLGYFGVYVEATYESITKILPIGDLTIQDTTVMRVEPRLESTGP